jgi:metallophosphoesterase superfamily enzyme
VPTSTAVLADLHLGYAAARRAVGEAVPDLDHRGWRRRLTALQRRGVRRLIVAGDLVERSCVWQTAARWARQQARLGVAVQLLPGNHDTGLPPLAGVELLVEPLQLGGWLIRHAPPLRPTQEACLVGHLHPALRLADYPQTVPCFLRRENTVVLPAQSDDVAGANVLALSDWQDARCLAVLRGQVIDLGLLCTLKRRLIAQRRRFRL